MIKTHEAKTLANHISCDFKWKFDSTTCNLNQKWSNRTCQCECQNYDKCKKDYSWNPSTCICEKYYCYFSNHVWWNYTCYGYCIKKNGKYYSNKMSINSYDEKTKYNIDFYIFQAVLLVIILLLIIALICYLYAKHRSKQKSNDAVTI